MAYLDDFLIFGTTEKECVHNLNLTIHILLKLGCFVINLPKCELISTTKCKFLGVIIDSIKMILKLPLDKKLEILSLVDNALVNDKIKLEKLVEIVGVLVAACPAVAYGWLYYKELESTKRKALFKHNNDMNN